MRRNNNSGYRPQKPKEYGSDKKHGLTVEVRNNDINKALRKFKKKVQEDGLLQEVRERQFYTKNGSSIQSQAKNAREQRQQDGLDGLKNYRSH